MGEHRMSVRIIAEAAQGFEGDPTLARLSRARLGGAGSMASSFMFLVTRRWWMCRPVYVDPRFA